MSHILLHRPNGEPLFVGKAHIRSFGDKWICIGEREDVAVEESIKEIAQALNLMTYELEADRPAPVPATPSMEALKERAEKAFVHNFKGLDYSNVGRKELAIDFAVNFALKERATTQGTLEGAK